MEPEFAHNAKERKREKSQRLSAQHMDDGFSEKMVLVQRAREMRKEERRINDYIFS